VQRGGGIKIFDSLLECGAEVDDKDNKSMTSLMLASYHGHIDIVKALVKVGAKNDGINADRMTALMLASEGDHLDVVDALIKSGADVDAVNKQRDTALKLANERPPAMGFNYSDEDLIITGTNANSVNNDGDKFIFKALIVACGHLGRTDDTPHWNVPP
jgi:uncharacterized protein